MRVLGLVGDGEIVSELDVRLVVVDVASAHLSGGVQGLEVRAKDARKGRASGRRRDRGQSQEDVSWKSPDCISTSLVLVGSSKVARDGLLVVDMMLGVSKTGVAPDLAAEITGIKFAGLLMLSVGFAKTVAAALLRDHAHLPDGNLGGVVGDAQDSVLSGLGRHDELLLRVVGTWKLLLVDTLIWVLSVVVAVEEGLTRLD